MITILLADDDPNILNLMALYIEKEGFVVKKASDGKEAEKILETDKIDLAVIDIMMPHIDGWQLCEEIRAYYDIPVLMVSARGQASDKVKGFKLGTDDYVVKPFDPIELVMRVKALLRRYHIQSAKNLSIGLFKMDAESFEVALGKEKISLPKKEFELLFKLASTPGKIFTRNQLIESIWGYDFQGDDRTIDVHVKRIRERFNSRDTPFVIKTMRGLGYRLELIK
ncbi:response regulator transcription factor [Alkalihalobacillus hwajinpoensis]|uniref:response regulator transcription factor n=1 Tax=Guptibacillus hwajinpoensis TaxID=208199 RepID=UPI001883CCD3|nr:response regulator transcription factor [Pseudalkalibacillus hwajinpoensis]MBF0707258.1 response regulator transcription factor [Pseudalkalibacillus hwajinpoensis]